MGACADALPRIREAVDGQLRTRSFSREKMLALALAVLDETLIRMGNGRYVRTNGSFGLTTLEHDHVSIDGSRVRFAFPGKSGHERDVEVRELGPATTDRDARSKVLDAADLAAERLGNTRVVALSSYVDPRVPVAYRTGELDGAWDACGRRDISRWRGRGWCRDTC